MLKEYKSGQKLYRIENYKLVEYEIVNTSKKCITLRNIKTGNESHVAISSLVMHIENNFKAFTPSKIIALTILADTLRKMSNKVEVELEEHRYELYERMQKYDPIKFSKPDKTIGDL